jgi:hypothetical protein
MHVGLGPIGAGVVRQVASRKGFVIVSAGFWGLSHYCETEPQRTCLQDANPGGAACNLDFEETCNAFCGYNNWVGDDCYWGNVSYVGDGWYCADDYFIRCVCTEVGR